MNLELKNMLHKVNKFQILKNLSNIKQKNHPNFTPRLILKKEIVRKIY